MTREDNIAQDLAQDLLEWFKSRDVPSPTCARTMLYLIAHMIRDGVRKSGDDPEYVVDLVRTDLLVMVKLLLAVPREN